MTTYYETKKCSAYYIEILQRVKRTGLIFEIGSSDVLIESGFENMLEKTTTIRSVSKRFAPLYSVAHEMIQHFI